MAVAEGGKRETLNIRIKAEVRGLIDRAAELVGKNRTDFVLDAARHAAEETLLDQLSLSRRTIRRLVLPSIIGITPLSIIVITLTGPAVEWRSRP